jgi:hypothetical protein
MLAAATLGACASAPEREATEATPATHEAEEPSSFERCHRTPKPEEQVLDEASRRVQQTVCGAALWFDGLFGEGDLQAARAAHGRIEVGVGHSDFEGWKTRVRFRATAKFPAMKQRISAFIGRDDDEEFVRDRSEGEGLRTQFPHATEEDDWLAGLGYSLRDKFGIDADFKAGAHGLTNPTGFVQLRLSYKAYTDENSLVGLRLTPFVNTRYGLGVTASMDIDRTLADSLLLRFGNIATIAEKSAGVDWRSALILYQSLADFRALGYELFIRGATDAAEPVGEYGGRLLFRQPLLERRLWLSPSVGYSWPRTDPTIPREGSLGVSIALELPFGTKR